MNFTMKLMRKAVV